MDTGMSIFRTAVVMSFLPIYRTNLPHDTVEERRANLQGFVVVVMHVDALVDAAAALVREPAARDVGWAARWTRA